MDKDNHVALTPSADPQSEMQPNEKTIYLCFIRVGIEPHTLWSTFRDTTGWENYLTLLCLSADRTPYLLIRSQRCNRLRKQSYFALSRVGSEPHTFWPVVRDTTDCGTGSGNSKMLIWQLTKQFLFVFFVKCVWRILIRDGRINFWIWILDNLRDVSALIVFHFFCWQYFEYC
jgi:hypothetical protein